MSQRHRHRRPAMVFGSKTVVPLIIVSRLFHVNRVRFRIRRIANGPQANARSFSPTSFAVRIRARCCKITSISNATKTRKGKGSRLDGCVATAARHLGSRRIHSTMQTANKIRAETIIDPRLHDDVPSIGQRRSLTTGAPHGERKSHLFAGARAKQTRSVRRAN